MAEPPLLPPHDPDLERALNALGSRLAFPPTPDLARAVRDALAAPPPRRRPIGLVIAPSPPRRWALAVLTLVLLLVALLALAPGVRTSIAKRLGVSGIAITFVTETPTPHPPVAASPVGPTLLLGERRTLAETRASVPYPDSSAGVARPPDEVYLRQVSAGSMVSLLYHPRSRCRPRRRPASARSSCNSPPRARRSRS